MNNHELSPDFTLDDVISILKRNLEVEIDEKVAKDVFEAAKKRFEFLKKGRKASKGFSENGFCITVDNLLYWYERLIQIKI